MRVLSIQPTVTKIQPQKRLSNTTQPTTNPEQPSQVSFKGNGNGAIFGLGIGVIGALGALCLPAIIAGAALLPSVAATAIMTGSGLAGGYVGDKIEDKLTGKKDDK